MTRSVAYALLVGCFAVVSGNICAQSAGGNGQASQNPSAPKPSKPAEANPFPTDTGSVPVIPTSNSPATPVPDTDNAAYSDAVLPRTDSDPVRSPDDGAPMVITEGSQSSSSDSAAGLDELLKPPPDTGKHRSPDAAPADGPKVDESVGSYYLSSHDWKGALSRFESALVLDPENPDVYWGMAEAQRHLGDYAHAKANYLKVIEYDPDSRHSKDAQKILKQPEMANAPTVASPAAPMAPPQN